MRARKDEYKDNESCPEREETKDEYCFMNYEAVRATKDECNDSESCPEEKRRSK